VNILQWTLIVSTDSFPKLMHVYMMSHISTMVKSNDSQWEVKMHDIKRSFCTTIVLKCWWMVVVRLYSQNLCMFLTLHGNLLRVRPGCNNKPEVTMTWIQDFFFCVLYFRSTPSNTESVRYLLLLTLV